MTPAEMKAIERRVTNPFDREAFFGRAHDDVTALLAEVKHLREQLTEARTQARSLARALEPGLLRREVSMLDRWTAEEAAIQADAEDATLTPADLVALEERWSLEHSPDDVYRLIDEVKRLRGWPLTKRAGQ